MSADQPGRSVRAGRTIEWDNAADDYGANRAPFPELVVDLLVPLGVGRPGEHLLDIGTGVGTPGLSFARRGARVTGVDPARAMLDVAKARAAEEGLDFTAVHAAAEATGLPDGCADSIVNGQSWHWFDHSAAMREFERLLVPGGRWAICSWDWVVGADALVDASLDVLRRHNPKVVAENPLETTKLRRNWLADVADGPFEPVADFKVRLDAPYTPSRWRGRLRASTWVNASLSPDEVRAVDDDLVEVLRDAPAQFGVPHDLRGMVFEVA